MALAVEALAEREVGRIILTRPAVEAGERLGFLPGDILAKVDPYLRPLFDALYDMLDADRLHAYMESGTIEVAPLAFMRGRTLNDSFIILDEAQNTSPEQMQMFLTRLGFGSKVVVTGDVTQIDLPRDQASGLIQVQDILGPIDGHRVRPLRARGRRPAQARPADRGGVQAPRRGDRHATAPVTLVLAIEIENRSGAEVDEEAAAALARAACWPPRGSTPASSGSRSSAPEEIRALKHEHLGIDEADGRALVPDRRPRRRCRPACRGSSATSCCARRSPARRGGRRSSTALLHLVGYDHGAEMEAREAEHA